MIDLHTHTWYSDGTLSPAQLVGMAAEKGIDTLAITDHDGIFGLGEGAEAAAEKGIRFICGVEFSASLPLGGRGWQPCGGGTPRAYMHILGYNFDPENAALLARLADIREQRKARNEKMLKALRNLGYPLTKEEIEVYPGQDYIGKPNFARALARRGYAADTAEAFASEHMMAAPSIRGIHRDKIEAEEAIALIRGAGGFTALAHPFKVSWPGKREEAAEVHPARIEEILRRLVGLGLTGLECCYSSHTAEQERWLTELAAKYQLIATAGSDYHGPGMKKNVELGGIHGI